MYFSWGFHKNFSTIFHWVIFFTVFHSLIFFTLSSSKYHNPRVILYPVVTTRSPNTTTTTPLEVATSPPPAASSPQAGWVAPLIVGSVLGTFVMGLAFLGFYLYRRSKKCLDFCQLFVNKKIFSFLAYIFLFRSQCGKRRILLPLAHFVKNVGVNFCYFHSTVWKNEDFTLITEKKTLLLQFPHCVKREIYSHQKKIMKPILYCFVQ